MSLFDTLKNAIFHHASAPPAPQPRASAVPVTPPGGVAAPVTPPRPATPAPAASTPPAPVDVEGGLDRLNSQQAQKLNWRTSIVDLMKLVGIDSSLNHRKQLAQELGYQGDTNDSAAMNVWLHKEVMKKLAANGGKVPSGLQ
jgi:hypothetical protein